MNQETLASAHVQLARGIPQTAGMLLLTRDRLELTPDQFASLGFGKRLELRLEDVQTTSMLGRFEGPALLGIAGRKIVLHMRSGQRHVFSFYLSSDIDAFHAELEAAICATRRDAEMG